MTEKRYLFKKNNPPFRLFHGCFIDAWMRAFQIQEYYKAVISLIPGYPKYKYMRAVKREKKNIFWID